MAEKVELKLPWEGSTQRMMYNWHMNKKLLPFLAIGVLLGAESTLGAKHDEPARPAPPHTHTELPLSVTPTQTAPISATRGQKVLRPEPATMHLSVPIPQIIYSEK